MTTETIYLDHDNTIDRILKSDGVAVDLSSVTKITATFGGVVITSEDKAAGSITWDQGGYDTGEIRLSLGGETIIPNLYTVPIIVYDASNPDGIVWEEISILVREKIETDTDPVLIATAGASNANTYATLIEAESYMETRLHINNWLDAIDNDKEGALAWATALLDRLCNWNGRKAVDTQALRWPRSFIYDPDGNPVSGSTIPQFLKDATAEFALHLIGSDFTITAARDTIGYKQIEVGSLNLVMDTAHGVVKKTMLPESVWIIVRSYCSRIGGDKRLVRV